MRHQTQQNRTLGINAGRERRIMSGNREEISATRRSEVFRQDVEHTGEEDAQRRKRVAAEKLEQIKVMCAQGHSCEVIARRVGYSDGYVRNLCRKNGIVGGK